MAWRSWIDSVCDKIYWSICMKRASLNILERMKSMRDGRRNTVYEVVWDADRVEVKWLTMENETGSHSFRWDDVLAVDTFKVDQFVVDCICLSFQMDVGWIETNEDMKGWGGFLDAVESRLPGFPKQEIWFDDVMRPAFEPNHARLWTSPNIA